VYAFFWTRCHQRDLCEELTSQVFLRALKGLHRWEWRGKPFSAWLFRIAANVLADQTKSAARRSEMMEQNDDAGGFTSEIERRVVLAELVSRLPHEQRQIVIMRFVEGKTAKEIAKIMNRSAGSVRQSQLRAMKTLRKEFSKSDE
jgi:RNA polymerase sigma-70 factor (ECF subfamily)